MRESQNDSDPSHRAGPRYRGNLYVTTISKGCQIGTSSADKHSNVACALNRQSSFYELSTCEFSWFSSDTPCIFPSLHESLDSLPIFQETKDVHKTRLDCIYLSRHTARGQQKLTSFNVHVEKKNSMSKPRLMPENNTNILNLDHLHTIISNDLVPIATI